MHGDPWAKERRCWHRAQAARVLEWRALRPQQLTPTPNLNLSAAQREKLAARQHGCICISTSSKQQAAGGTRKAQVIFPCGFRT